MDIGSRAVRVHDLKFILILSLISTIADKLGVRTGQLVSIRDYKSRGCGFDSQSDQQIFFGAPPLGLL